MPWYHHIILVRKSEIFVRWTSWHNIQTNQGNTQMMLSNILCTVTSIHSHGRRMRIKPTVGVWRGREIESSQYEGRDTLAKACGNDRWRVLRAFGKTNVEIEIIMLISYHYSTSDIIHAYFSRWSECNPYGNLRVLIKTLSKSKLHLYAGHFNYLFHLRNKW